MTENITTCEDDILRNGVEAARWLAPAETGAVLTAIGAVRGLADDEGDALADIIRAANQLAWDEPGAMLAMLLEDPGVDVPTPEMAASLARLAARLRDAAELNRT